jgi:hypothetical protein
MKSKILIPIAVLILVAATVFAASIDYADYNVGFLEEGKDVKLEIRFKGEANGEIKLFSEDNLVASKEVSGDTVLAFKVPPEVKSADGGSMQDLTLRYYENNVEVDKKELGQFWGQLLYVKDGKVESKDLSLETRSLDSDWGTIDFRLLKAEKETDMPVEVVIENRLNKEITVKITISSVKFSGDYGTKKDYDWQLKPGNNNRRFDFSVNSDETSNDIEVVAEYNGDKISDLQNSFIRLDPSFIKEGKLPERPGEILNKEMEKAEQQLTSVKSSDKTATKSYANLIAIIIAVILLGIVAAAGYFFLRKRH